MAQQTLRFARPQTLLRPVEACAEAANAAGLAQPALDWAALRGTATT